MQTMRQAECSRTVIRSLNRMTRHESFVPLPLKQICILLAEDHAHFRKSLKVLVELEEDIKVIGEAKNGIQAVELNEKLHPDVVVMDIAMPLLNGLQATRQIIETSPATKVLILSSHADPEYIRQAMILGASGYLIKQSSAPVLASAIREVMSGKTYFSTSIPKQLRDECQKVFNRGELPKKHLN